jgi:hypothetical protein
VQFLGFPPGSAIAIFAQVFNDQPHIFQMPDARFRMPKPKALRMRLHQLSRARD